MTARLLTVVPDRSPEWLQARRGRVGGSDVGVLVGANPFRDHVDLDRTEAAGEPSSAQERGIYCEQAILAWLCAKEHLELDAERSSGIWCDGDDDRLIYSPDGVTTGGVLLEAKTTHTRDKSNGWGRAGTDQIPASYMAQVQWGLGILGLDRAVLGVLAGQPTFGFARYKIRFDRWVFNRLRVTAVDFLDQLQAEGTVA